MIVVMLQANPARAPAGKGAETRRRVVAAAAAAIRAHGPDRVGVAAVMRQAGLTHGGFYAHFPCKDALVAAAVEHMLDGGDARFAGLVRGRRGRAALQAVVEAYVSPRHRDRPQHGCPFALLAPDVARQPEPVRRAFAQGLERFVARLCSHLPDTAHPSREAFARALLCEMAGAVALARALPDRDASDAFLAGARAALDARLDTLEF